MPKRKPPQPPPNEDPEQSKRFMKFAGTLATEDTESLFENAMSAIAKPARLPDGQDREIITPAKQGTNMPNKAKKKK